MWGCVPAQRLLKSVLPSGAVLGQIIVGEIKALEVNLARRCRQFLPAAVESGATATIQYCPRVSWAEEAGTDVLLFWL